MYSSSEGLAFVASVVLNADSSAERKLHQSTMKAHLCGESTSVRPVSAAGG